MDHALLRKNYTLSRQESLVLSKVVYDAQCAEVLGSQGNYSPQATWSEGTTEEEEEEYSTYEDER